MNPAQQNKNWSNFYKKNKYSTMIDFLPTFYPSQDNGVSSHNGKIFNGNVFLKQCQKQRYLKVKSLPTALNKDF